MERPPSEDLTRLNDILNNLQPDLRQAVIKFFEETGSDIVGHNTEVEVEGRQVTTRNLRVSSDRLARYVERFRYIRSRHILHPDRDLPRLR